MKLESMTGEASKGLGDSEMGSQGIDMEASDKGNGTAREYESGAVLAH